MQKDIFAHEKHAQYATTYQDMPFFLIDYTNKKL